MLYNPISGPVVKLSITEQNLTLSQATNFRLLKKETGSRLSGERMAKMGIFHGLCNCYGKTIIGH